MTRRAALAATAVLLLLLAACGSDGDGQTVSQGPAATSTTSAAASDPTTTDGPLGRGSGDFEGSDGTTTGSPTDPDAPVANEPGDDTAPEPAGATEVPNRTDLVDPRTVEPDAVTVDPTDDTRVRVSFYGGVQACYGAEVTVAETAEAVVVTLRTGTIPTAPDACIDLAEHQQVTVELAEPLGTRTLSATPAG